MIPLIAMIIVVLATILGVAFFARGIVAIVRTLRVGQPQPSRTRPVGRRIWQTAVEVVGHSRLNRKPFIAAAHWLVMVSFPVLFLTLVQGYRQILDPAYTIPVIGRWAPWEWATEFFAWAGLIGIVALTCVRLVRQPHRGHSEEEQKRSRFFGSNFWQAYYVEATIFGVVLCVITLRALEYALDPGAAANDFPMTFFLGELMRGASSSALETAIVIVSALKILVSMSWLVTIGLLPTMGVAWHRFLAFVNVYLRRNAAGGSALGPAVPMMVGSQEFSLDAVDDMDEDTRLGVGAVEEFTWKGLLDFASCTECGRCQEQCPAWHTEKPLSPKLMVLALRDHAAEKAPVLRGLARDEGPVDALALAGQSSVLDASLIGDVFEPDALWSCTTCGACVEQCPVDIEHVDHIINMRRNQVLMESAFPSELGQMFKKLESKANPWGMAPRARMDWAKGLDVEIRRVGVEVESLTEVDYLFWVGCAGAYEDKARRTTRAVVELLDEAGISFAVLGDGEACTGDPARRAGNEVLFQMLAAQNIETLTEAEATRIVVTCAHCFNTLSREYPQLGGTYEVVHHTQLLNRLVREGKLTPVTPDAAEANGERITYHDPCYLGRHNDVYSPPRELVEQTAGVTGGEFVELPRSRSESFCCGAGGARVWVEERIGERINANRAQEVRDAGATTVATACPYCHVMLTDGVAATGTDEDGAKRDSVRVADVAELLLEAVRRRQ